MVPPAEITPKLPRPAKTAAATAVAPPKPTFQELGDTLHAPFNRMVLRQALASYTLTGGPTDDGVKTDAILTGMMAMAPKDALEGMMAAQLLGLHNAAMECLNRAAMDGQTFEGRQANLTQAAKLSRTYALIVDTLDRHRGGGTQKIIVERVTVNAGGQAIVGNVARTQEGVTEKSEEQPHAKQLAHAPVAALSGLDASGDALPVTSNAKRPLPHARRTLPRRP